MKKTLEDIARAAGVGIATVDRVMNERGNVSPKTEAKVISAAQALGIRRFIPQPFRHGLRFDILLPSKRTHLAQKMSDEFKCISESINKNILLQRIHVDNHNAAECAEKIRNSQCNALIVFCPEKAVTIEEITAKTASGVPVITLASDMPTTPRLAYIGIDHFKAGRAAAYFLETMNSCENEAFIVCSNIDYRSQAERVSGFRAAWAEIKGRQGGMRVFNQLEQGSEIFHQFCAVLAGKKRPSVYIASGEVDCLADAVHVAGVGGLAKIVAHDLSEANCSLVREGVINIIIDESPFLLARNAVDTLIDRFTGEKQSVSNKPIPFTIYMRENIE